MSDSLDKCFDVLTKQINEYIKAGFIEIVRKDGKTHLNIVDPVGLALAHSKRIKKIIKESKIDLNDEYEFQWRI